MNEDEANALLMSVEDLGYLSPEKTEMLLGAITRMQPMQKRAAISKLTQTRVSAGGANLSSRDEAMMRLGMLPENIRKGLAEKRLQLADTIFYAVKAAGAGTTIKMITNADVKSVGISNFANGKLDKDNYLLLTHVRLTSGISVIGAVDTAFGIAGKEILNGQVEFKAGTKYLLPNECGNKIFDTTNQTDITTGTYRLANPKWLEPQQQIEFNLSLSQAAPVNTFIRVELIGSAVIPY
ncbi:MAG: hypothetical protein Q7W13_13070 [Bacteroidia bacterium]|nr:hypothetical protein [Bacteroidia bacterium]